MPVWMMAAMPGWAVGLIVAAVVLLVVGGIIGIVVWWFKTHNQLVQLNQRVKNGWAQIDVQLKKRYDLIPNLVETVKGYATHEKETLSEVTMYRSKATSATNPKDVMEANNGLSGALQRLLVSVERYPELKANSNFLQLQGDLKNIENAIAYARQFYNDVVQKNNEKIEMFPSSIVAKHYKSKFKTAEFFELKNEEMREAPKVQF